MNRAILFCLALVVWLAACTGQKADLLVYNAKIYTVNEGFDIAQAMAVKDGKILALGTNDELKAAYRATTTFDAEGKAIYPGFIDAHAHFVGYAESLNRADLTGANSWDEVLQRLQEFAKSNPEAWLLGRGWDQNDWDQKQFPTKERLDQLFPDRPVYLTRIDGHAAIANQKALDIAGVKDNQSIAGGELIKEKGKLTGLLVDNAMELVSSKIPPIDQVRMKQLLIKAQDSCFAQGLTTIDDCGLDYQTVEKLEQLQKSGNLKMRLYIMLSDSPKNFDYLAKRGIIKTDRLHVRGFKVFADGALGSRGACLLHPYSDRSNTRGFLLSKPSHFLDIAKQIKEKGFQMCTHAIGDSANRTILKIYEQVLGAKNDERWRIEHAQVVNANDFVRFGQASIIPSVQPTHATSDMYWAKDRLGAERVKGAYAYQQLLQQNGWLALGTDFPVEHINPMFTYYAATARKDAKAFPKGGFQSENALTPEQTLRGMTIWAAKANFEEKEKGSLEPGKMADFIVLEHDLLKADDQQILKNKVIRTYLNGEKVYEKK